jgi:hypothetical protein
MNMCKTYKIEDSDWIRLTRRETPQLSAPAGGSGLKNSERQARPLVYATSTAESCLLGVPWVIHSS